MKTVSKVHKWLRLSAVAGLLALSPLVFSNGSNGENLVQLSEATCSTCCYEEKSKCVYGENGEHYYDYFYQSSGSCNEPE